MNNPPNMDWARRLILHPNQLDEVELSRALEQLAAGADFADMFFESTKSREWRLDNGKVSAGSFSIGQGLGSRAVRGDQVSFAHTSDLRPEAIRSAHRTVQALTRLGGGAVAAPSVPLVPQLTDHGLYSRKDPLASANLLSWVQLLEKVDMQARAAHPAVRQVNASLSSAHRVVLIANTDGQLVADARPVTRLFIHVVLERAGTRAQGSAGVGGRYGLEGLTDEAVASVVSQAVRVATVNLDARPAPGGVMPVVLGPGYAGVLFHEAVGHGLEGDHHRKGLSVFACRMGERIAPEMVTVLDDGSLPGRLGSVGVDDEGAPGQRTALIENGVLTGLMQDRLNARLMDMTPTGNARRQSYAHLPMPRMTNTFLLAGQEDPTDIVASVARGIYAPRMGGGQVDITSGRFNFTAVEAYLIEDGKITAPVKGVTLVGVGHEALRHIRAVGHDWALDEGIATCGKAGQTVSVSVGQPTLRIDEMVVSGSV
ncbi:microcin-processing peptidase 2 [Nitrospirillum amazonense]|uniref:Microcin-processing peptidase 2 n=1 Tax=Nitrospirillum amazonense TaxID=28077 RepID=A0A560FQ52_9PROT|nr:metalloprotease TldD [Nitrospirillum amazonense]TWB23739.1 microcin-processing peptidase 2 [Nitrospirillum amazonense]